jgi:hypothetical protein
VLGDLEWPQAICGKIRLGRVKVRLDRDDNGNEHDNESEDRSEEGSGVVVSEAGAER